MKRKILESECKSGSARGRLSRTGALMAAVAICACTAVRLDAVVIDDFENGVKWAEGGGGTNYFLWGLTNGQMVISKQNPIPTPKPGVLTTYDNVYWPDSLPGVSLEGGRTLELRMDLNHTSADDLFLVLMCGGLNEGRDSGYMAIIDRNEVALMKYGEHFTAFYWDTLATTNENVTVKLALAKTNSSLAITVKVVDKDNQRATLHQRTFVDGPGQDGPVPPPDPHGAGFFTADLSGPFTNFTYAAVGCWQVIFSSPPPLEMLLDNLEYDVYYPPHLDISRATNGVDLLWNLPLEEHIVVQADQLAGPWSPCPQPHTRIGDAFWLNMPCPRPQKFWRLAPGRQYTNDFSSAVPTWMDYFKDGGEQWYVTNGVLNFTGISAQYPGFLVMPLGTNAAAKHEDFLTSVDILDWVTSGTNWSVVSLFGRGIIYSPTYANGYIGLLILNSSDIPGQVTLSMVDGYTEVYGPSFDMAAHPLPYRLEFSGVGKPICQLRLRVLSLPTMQLIREQTLVATRYTEGFPGFWINYRNQAGDTYTITTDNYLVIGTKP